MIPCTEGYKLSHTVERHVTSALILRVTIPVTEGHGPCYIGVWFLLLQATAFDTEGHDTSY